MGVSVDDRSANLYLLSQKLGEKREELSRHHDGGWEPAWKCGMIGHLAIICPAKKATRMPPKSDPPRAKTTCSVVHVMDRPTAGTSGQKAWLGLFQSPHSLQNSRRNARMESHGQKTEAKFQKAPAKCNQVCD